MKTFNFSMRLKAVFLTIAVALAWVSPMADAGIVFTDNGIKYEVISTSPKQVRVVATGSYSGDITIPSQVNGYTVTGIGDNAFSMCIELYSVTLPQTIRIIEKEAFLGCTGLTSMVIPKEVTSIGEDAFAYCASLHDLTFNARQATFTGAPFRLASVQNLVIGDDVVSLPDSMMRDNVSLASVTIGKNVTWPGIAPFFGCTNLQTVQYNATHCDNTNDPIVDYESSFYEQFGTVYNYIFYKSVETITFGSNVEYLPNNLLMSSKLKQLRISDNISQIERNSLSYDSITSMYIGKSLPSIESLNFPKTLTSFSLHSQNPYFTYQDRVLYDKNITKILVYMPFKDDEVYDLPSTITTISAFWFWGPSIPYLKVLNLPATVKKIELYDNEIPGFTIRDTGLRAINVDSANPYYSSIDGVLYNRAKTELIVYPPGKLEETYVCPNGLKVIGPYASRYNHNLRTLVLSNDVEILSEYCFAYAKQLETVRLNKCKVVSRNAFNSDSTLKTIIFGQGLQCISNGAFRACVGLTSISLPEGLTFIGNNAFYGCANLASVSLPSSLLSLGTNAFYQCNFTSINIPDGLLQMGRNSLPTTWLNAQTADNYGVVYAGKIAYRCYGSSSIVFIKDGTIGLAGGSFPSNVVTEIEFPSSLESIGQNALNSTQWYYNQTPVNGVIYAGNVALARSSNATTVDEIVLRPGTKGIAARAFYGNNCKAKKIVIPSTVTNIGEAAFDTAQDLDTLIIEEGVRAIGHYAIDEIYDLKYLSLPSTLQAYDQGLLIPGTGYNTPDYKLHVAFPMPPVVDKSCFFCAGWGHQDPRTHATLIVPVGTKANYKQAREWKEFYRILEEGETLVVGDVDGDGEVNVIDITALIDIIMNDGTDPSADVNEDGEINVIDITALIDIIMNS